METKIIATYGPSVSSSEKLNELVDVGASIIRYNISHADYQHCIQFQETMALVSNAACLVDTNGPEIRIGTFARDSTQLEVNQQFTLFTHTCVGNQLGVSISYKDITSDVERGDTVYVDDGRIVLRVIDITEDGVVTQVMQGGLLSNHKGVNIPGKHIDLEILSEKDKTILASFASAPDYVAVSFTRSIDDIMVVRNTLQALDFKHTKIIAKIENQEGLDNLESIISGCDGIMIARGDLGIEVPYERVPFLQREIIKRCHHHHKLSIVATQMLESMIQVPKPTRAEVSDVANAVFEGASFVMLSAETAVGDYPIEAVTVMRRICDESYRHRNEL